MYHRLWRAALWRQDDGNANGDSSRSDWVRSSETERGDASVHPKTTPRHATTGARKMLRAWPIGDLTYGRLTHEYAWTSTA